MGETTDRVNELAGSILMIEAVVNALVLASPSRDAILDGCEDVARRLQGVAEEINESDASGLSVHRAMYAGARKTLDGIRGTTPPAEVTVD